MTNPDDPYPAGRFSFPYCALAIRSASRILMLCPNSGDGGPVLRIFDTTTFTSVGALTLPGSLYGAPWLEIAYLGGDAVALLPADMPLQIMRAPLIGAQP